MQSCACGAKTDLVLCRRCGTHLRGELLAVPDLIADLRITRYRLDRIAASARSSGETPVAWSEDAADAQARLVSAVAGIPLPGAGAPNTASARALWLAERVVALRGCDGVDEAVERLSGAVRGAREVIDRPEMRTRFVVGPCPMPGPDATVCPGRVWAYLPHDGAPLLECRTDENHRWTAERWLRAGRLILRRIADLNNMQAAG